MRRLKRVAARCVGRLIAVLLIVALACGVVGIPVASHVAKDRSQPFPCQDNPCGCASADECWHHCCCHTNREKVVWAHEHGVTPPDYVVAAAEKEERADAQVCHHGHCPACAAKAAQHKGEATADAGTGSQRSKLRFRLVLSDLARRCQGLASIWTVLAHALPPRVEPDFSIDERVVGRVVDPPVLVYSVDASPPVPPPKLAARCA